MNPKTPKITDDLLAEAKSGDRESCGAICKMMEPAIRTIAVRFCKMFPTLDMDDLVQIGHLTVLKAIQRFDPTRKAAAFSSYAYESVLNKVRSAASVEGKHNSSLVAGKGRMRVDIDDVDVEVIESPEEWNATDGEFFGRLTQIEARVVSLRLWGAVSGGRQATWSEIAKQLGIKRDDAERIYREAIEKIRED